MDTKTMPAMPARIAVLPRDRRGYPVPYSAQWRSEDETLPVAGVRRLLLPGVDFTGHICAETDTIGVGHPQFANVEPGRQIRCHEHSLCGVCGTQIGRKLTFVGGDTRDQGQQYYTEAPLHRECARWALAVCPGLLVPHLSHDTILVVSLIDRNHVTYAGRFVSATGDTHHFDFDNPITTLLKDRMVLMNVVAITDAGTLLDSRDYMAEWPQ